MSIYTRTGDAGETALFGGRRVLKSNMQVEAYGSCDELSATLGILIALDRDEKRKTFLTAVQRDLHLLMGFLAGKADPLTVLSRRVAEMERAIDRAEEALPPLHGFLLPQGRPLSVYAHIARTVCRRSERALVKLGAEGSLAKQPYELALMFLNRLSDYLFMVARLTNTKEVPV